MGGQTDSQVDASLRWVGQTDSQVGSQVHASRKSRKFHDYTDDLESTATKLGWWPNGEKLTSTLRSTKVNALIASQHTWVGKQNARQVEGKQKTCVDLRRRILDIDGRLYVIFLIIGDVIKITCVINFKI